MLESQSRFLKTCIRVRDPIKLWATISAPWIRGWHHKNIRKTSSNHGAMDQNGQKKFWNLFFSRVESLEGLNSTLAQSGSPPLQAKVGQKWLMSRFLTILKFCQKLGVWAIILFPDVLASKSRAQKTRIRVIIMIFYCGVMFHITETRAQKVVSYIYISAHYRNGVCTWLTLGGAKLFILTTAVSSFA